MLLSQHLLAHMPIGDRTQVVLADLNAVIPTLVRTHAPRIFLGDSVVVSRIFPVGKTVFQT